jgi:predicted transposase YdaD
VAKAFDATMKHLVEAHPADWLVFAGMPTAATMEVIDADVSSVGMAADKVVRVMAPDPYIAHLEFQSGADADIDRRMLFYNVLLRWRHNLPVRSVVILLRPQAQAGVSGRMFDSAAEDAHLDFRYRVIRVWEQPVEAILAGGVGTLPLAAIAATGTSDLPAVANQIIERLSRETAPGEFADTWTATVILAGLRHSREVVAQLMKGVRNMKDSVTYQMIIEEGIGQGIEKGIEKGIEQGRVSEAKAILLKIASRRFGPPPADVAAQLEGVSDLRFVESLIDRTDLVSGWKELLAGG